MVRVAPVKLAHNPRTLWFDPRDLDVRKGDAVVVLTARGLEFGVAEGVVEVEDAEVKKLKTPLKPVKRLATEEDEARAAEMERLSAEALPVFKEMVEGSQVAMRPISVEYLLEGDKAVFYFEAEERVDFRDLVRQLAARFHVRVDMRQIGVRDEARMVGGLGHCGQELCCKRLGGEFCPVSIRMAKEQDLSLNPQKISGVCGRLMCCLRYEFDAYKDFKSRAPKANATVQTPEGPAKVVDLDVPREVVSLRLEGEKPVKVPLADFDPPEEGKRPNTVGAEAWEAARASANAPTGAETVFLTSQFTQADKLAEAGSVRRTGGGRAGRTGAKADSGEGAKGRRAAAKAADEQPTRKPRRRSTKVGSSADGQGSVAQTASKRGAQDASARAPETEGRKKRTRNRTRSKQGGQNTASAQREGGESAQQRGGSKDKARGGKGQGAVRPGQKSSGLRQQQAKQGGAKPATDEPARKPRRRAQESGEGASEGASGAGTHRRARRRSHTAGGGSDAGAGTAE